MYFDKVTAKQALDILIEQISLIYNKEIFNGKEEG